MEGPVHQRGGGSVGLEWGGREEGGLDGNILKGQGASRRVAVMPKASLRNIGGAPVLQCSSAGSLALPLSEPATGQPYG